MVKAQSTEETRRVMFDLQGVLAERGRHQRFEDRVHLIYRLGLGLQNLGEDLEVRAKAVILLRKSPSNCPEVSTEVAHGL